MRLAHIKGIATYHKRIIELEMLGYIHYQPKSGSKVFEAIFVNYLMCDISLSEFQLN